MAIYYTPHPVLFSMGPFTVYGWGLLNALAILIAGFLVFKKAKRHFDEKTILGIIISGVISGLIFARIFYILIYMNEFSTFWSLFEVWNGGLEGFGTFIGGILGVFFYAKIKKIDACKFLDIAAPYIALGYAIGRIGCFLRGCCFGIPTNLPWGIIYSEGSLAAAQYLNQAVHPTQLYHSIADFIIFAVLIFISRKKERQFIKKKSGGIFLLFLALYSIERFFIDLFRWHSSSQLLAFGISIEQLFYLLLFIASILIIRIRNRKP